jgi:hypothetical protein
VELARLACRPRDANKEGRGHRPFVIHLVFHGLKKPRLHLGVTAVAHSRNLPCVLLLLPPVPDSGFFRSFAVACRGPLE